MHTPNGALEGRHPFGPMIVDLVDMTIDAMNGHSMTDVGQWMILHAKTQVGMMSLMLPLVHEQVGNRILAL